MFLNLCILYKYLLFILYGSHDNNNNTILIQFLNNYVPNLLHYTKYRIGNILTFIICIPIPFKKICHYLNNIF